MGKIYMVACPQCGFTYPVDEVLLTARVEAHCPRCHHEFRPEDEAVSGPGKGSS